MGGNSKKEDETIVIAEDEINIENLEELRDFIRNLSNKAFAHYVNEEKNDFENWARESFEETELADLLRKKKTKEETIQVIDYFLTREEIKESKTGPKKQEIPEVEWVKIGVPGFDELITNGVPKGSSVLISGGPGTGKTTFCLQVLKQAVENGEKCLYLTFEEASLRLKQHMKSYGWDPVKMEKDGYIIIKKMQAFDLSRSVEALLAKASGELTIELDEIEGIIPKNFKPDRIILDSLSAVAAAFTGKEEGYRIYIEQLFSLFKSIGATSFLITEIEQETNRYSRTGIEEFLADAVFVFYNIRQKNVRLNALEVLKIRGTSHQKKIVPFKIIKGQGIIVYPQEEVFT